MTARDILFNDGWQFCLTDIGTPPEELESRRWYDVSLPHDWLIGDTDNLYKTGEGRYRRKLQITAAQLEGRVFINFDGVYMDSAVFVNGAQAGSWRYGYTAFEFDITDFLHEGENELLVRIDHRAPNSRWYSGAGIYRDVTLKFRPKTYIANDGIYIHSDKYENDIWVTKVETDICGEAADITLILEVYGADGTPIGAFRQTAGFEGGRESFLNEYSISAPALWDIYQPNLYTLRVSLFCGGALLDSQDIEYGYKDVRFVPDKGIAINGRIQKMHGVCMHHDLGALGSAFNASALYRQLMILAEMGVNSIRTSHNPPARQFMEMCDHIGLLVDSECFDMWEIPKTEFDNARFFNDTCEQDVKAWVERDRNHASLLMWSIGNEILDTNNERGIEITAMLRDYVHKYDPKHNARVTIGSNFMTSENAQRCSDELKIAGYNYTERLYNEHHAKYPDWTIYGSETASAVRSRGIYHFPIDKAILTYPDLQCSSLDNSVVGWGASARKSWRLDRDCDFCGGQYIWTGFDYIGEPTPYSTKNSYFGIVDTAGFPKDVYYFYRSVWTDKPVLHIAPCYWDFGVEGSIIDVIVYSNARRVELFLNGAQVGAEVCDITTDEEMRFVFRVPYAAGELTAKGYDPEGRLIAEQTLRTPGDPAAVQLAELAYSDKAADGRSITFVEISVCDRNGNPVGNARNRVKVQVSGEGRLVGLDNGDSTDYDSYKGDNRRLFSGRLLAMIQHTKTAGEVKVTATSAGLAPAELVYSTEAPHYDTAGIGTAADTLPVKQTEYTAEIPARMISLTSSCAELSPENPAAHITARLFPANTTYTEISWKAFNPNGVEIKWVDIVPTADGADITPHGDGAFTVLASCANGGDVPQVFSQLEFKASGLGEVFKNPYEFITASLLDGSDVPVNDFGNNWLGSFEGRTVMSYKNVDFGDVGTEKLTLFIGTCFDMCAEVWDGTPENGRLIISADFKNNSGWDKPRPQEYALAERLRGVHEISVVIADRVIFGGFSFEQIARAFDENYSAECDEMYGDEFTKQGRSIVKIGNNVILSWNAMDFGAQGASAVIIKGITPKPENPVQLRFTPEGGEQSSMFLNFAFSEDVSEQRFEIPRLTGVNDISFVFLPGTKFDFISFRFEK
ncbi:MAG: glycoside hydrolase family 2 TIM barrel-domain containing protein [Oscillospiraceae bacterium]